MELNVKTFGQGPALVILHGLFGSLDNWVTLGKKLSESFSVYLVDQRNHGKSPHDSDFNYDVLAEDLEDFLDSHGIFKAHLIGHSMGGKTVMRFASLYPERIDQMMVVDMAPKRYEPHHTEILKALNSIELTGLASRQEADEALQEGIPETSVRQFLLKSLARNGKEGFRWKFNLKAITEMYTRILESVEDEAYFPGEVLFLSGGKSEYVSDSDHEAIREQFPQATFISLPEAGHWIHADAPDLFLQHVSDFFDH